MGGYASEKDAGMSRGFVALFVDDAFHATKKGEYDMGF